jgi:multidrug efflux pump subunit AcrA (membrane-fusion protein)
MQKNALLKIIPALLILAIAASCADIAGITGLQKEEAPIPVARVVREPIEVSIHTLGELLPAKTATIIAPPVAGGMLQIAYLAETGSYVKQGDIVVQFDPSEQEYNLAQSKSQLAEAEQQIKKMKADQAVRVAQEQLSLLKAQYEVQRAELKTRGNDLLSGIEARKNVLSLEEAKRKLEQLQRDIKSRADSDAADLAVQNVARTKAMLGMKLAQQFIDNMTIRAPISGIVVVGQSIEALMSASGSITISSETDIPQYRPGSPAYPGRTIASIQQVDQMEIAAKVIETDRANLESGQGIEVMVDSKPAKIYKGKIKSLAQSALSSASASTTLEYLEALSTRSFPVIFQVDTEGDRLNLGVTARVAVKGKDLRDALSIPRQALHQKEGERIVYVRREEGFEPHKVQVQYLTESRAVIEGIEEGTEVALVNPEKLKSKASGKTSPLTSILGGG